MKRSLPLLVGILVAQAAQAQEPDRFGVFNLRVVGMPQEIAEPAIDALADTLSSLNVGEVVTTRDLEAMIAAERRAEALGCDQLSCLVEIGSAAGVSRLVTGSLARVDESLVASLQLVDIHNARVHNRITLKWAGPDSGFSELLGAAAELLVLPASARPPGTLRLTNAPSGATWWVGQQEVDQESIDVDAGVYTVRVEAIGHSPMSEQVIARVGQTTAVAGRLEAAASQEVVGIGVQIGAFLPLADTYPETEPGLSISGNGWFELSAFVIQPRFGVRFDVTGDNQTDFLELAADVGASWLMLRTSVTPFVGAAVGARWVRFRETEAYRVGSIISVRQSRVVEDEGVGIAGYARGGLLMFRDRSFRLLLGADYNLAYAGSDNKLQGLELWAGFVL